MIEEQNERMSAEKLEKIASDNLKDKRTSKGSAQQRIEIVVIVVLLITLIGMNRAIGQMKLQMDQLEMDMSRLENTVSSEISAQVGEITTSIDTSLKKSDSIVADYSYRVQPEQIDRKSRTVPITLSIRPKEDKAGLKVTFLIETEDGRIITAAGEKGDANTYSAAVSVPIKDYLKLGVTFDDGATQKSEKLEDLYQPFDSMIMKVDSFMSSCGTTKADDKTFFEGTVETTITQSADGMNYPAKATLQILKNGKLLKTIPISLEENPASMPQTQEAAALAGMANNTTTTYYTQLKEELKMKSNAIIEVRVIVVDNYGFSYKQIIDNEMIGIDGSMNPANYSGEVVIE